MDAYLNSDGRIAIGDGRFVSRLALADALIRSGQLTATGQLPA